MTSTQNIAREAVRVRALVRQDHEEGKHDGRNIAACVLCGNAPHPWDAEDHRRWFDANADTYNGNLKRLGRR